MTGSKNEAVNRHNSDKIDPLYIAGARDALYTHVSGRVLNVGLGYGVWDDRLNRDRNIQVTGLDIELKLVREFTGRYSGITYVCADVLTYQPDEPFDTIIASHLIDRVDDPVTLLRRFASWLKPSGRVIVVVPNANSLHRIIGQAIGLLAEVTNPTEADLEIGRRRAYTRETLERDIRASDLRGTVRNLGLKPLSDSQLTELPRNYVDACCKLHDMGNAYQLGVVLTR
jgi:2-polyprenyl-3-methyl-5-hydroxy-6-metoxy-1,4-benzoquinol methylase